MGTIAKNDIVDQVNKICQYPEIRAKKIICKFLRFVVQETLEGKGAQLKGYTIGLGVLGKDEDFDAEQDSLVRIHAGRLRRLLRTYYLDAGKNDQIFIDIPKGGYQPVFSSNGLSKENIQSENYNTTTPKREPSIAVLPFRNLTGDPEKEHFSFGFSEELSIELTKYEDLEVMNCWQRPKFKNNKSLFSILGAHYFIDGSVQDNEKDLHILVKLIDAISGKQLWADRYVRDLSMESLIEMQEEIADTIAKTVGSELGVIMKQLSAETSHIRPENLEVFDATLHFYYWEAHMSESIGSETYVKLQQALSNNPTSGLIHALLAAMSGTALSLGYSGDNHREKMIELMDEAMRLDADNVIVRVANSFRYFLSNDKDNFLEEVNHCLSLNIVSPLRLGAVGFYLSLFGYWEKGKVILDKAMKKNTGFPLFFHGATCLYYYRLNKYKEALKEAQKYDVQGLFWGPLLRAACMGKMDERKKARSQVEQLLLLKPDFETKAQELLSYYIKEDELLLEVLDGLRKAGLSL